jgi:hypothetical protein
MGSKGGTEQVYVYRIKNLINGKVYIGQTVSNPPEMRWGSHLSSGKSRKKSTRLLDRAMRDCTPVAFTFQVIYQAKSLHELNRMEHFFVFLYQSFNPEFGYNHTIDGGNIDWRTRWNECSESYLAVVESYMNRPRGNSAR